MQELRLQSVFSQYSIILPHPEIIIKGFFIFILHFLKKISQNNTIFVYFFHSLQKIPVRLDSNKINLAIARIKIGKDRIGRDFQIFKFCFEKIEKMYICQ